MLRLYHSVIAPSVHLFITIPLAFEQKYFTILEEKGMFLLCQHLDETFIKTLNIKQNNTDSTILPIDIPHEQSQCPLPFIQQHLVGNDNASYTSLRKEYVLKLIVDKVSKKMKDQGFSNRSCYEHSLQFRRCLNEIVSNMKGADEAYIDSK